MNKKSKLVLNVINTLIIAISFYFYNSIIKDSLNSEFYKVTINDINLISFVFFVVTSFFIFVNVYICNILLNSK